MLVLLSSNHFTGENQMAHLMKTINEDAARDNVAVEPLPGVGESVVFYPRPGELRAGRGKHAAIVTASNEDDQSLDIVVVYDADDFIGQRRVKRRSLDGGMGWEPLPTNKTLPARQLVEATENGGLKLVELTGPLEKRIAALEANHTKTVALILGEFLPPKESLVEIMGEHEDRMQKIEDAAKTKAKKATKTKGK